MGFDKVEDLFIQDGSIASRYREEFPITKELIYLNHAAVAPLCRRAADAVR